MKFVHRLKQWRPPRRWIVLLGRLAALVAAGLGVAISGTLVLYWLPESVMPVAATPAGQQAQLDLIMQWAVVLRTIGPCAFLLRQVAFYFTVVTPRFSFREKVFWAPAVLIVGSLAAAPLFWIWAGRLERGELAGGRPEPVEALAPPTT